MHVLGEATLDSSDLFRVEAQLKQMLGARSPRELRLDRLVGAVR